MPIKKIIIAGGGTGGHIYPAIAIANAINRDFPNVKVIFVGTNKGLERELVPKAGFQLKKIRVRGFQRRLSLDTLKSLKEMFLGIWDSLKIIKEEKPDLVIGTGGYVAGPVVFVASMLHIPSIIHEQNVKPGVTNRILSKFVDKIAISYDDSKKYFPREKIILTGNPVRDQISSADKETALKKFKLSPDIPVVFSFGGSQGAAKLNDAISNIIEQIKDKKTFQLIHITGKQNYSNFKKLMRNKGIPIDGLGHIKIEPYIYDMQDAYAASDLVISRAGAITISEITTCGKPAILIPLPTAAGNHQEYNARLLEENGAAKILDNKDLTGKNLMHIIEKIILDKKQLESMAKASRELQNPHALNKIINEISYLIGI